LSEGGGGRKGWERAKTERRLGRGRGRRRDDSAGAETWGRPEHGATDVWFGEVLTKRVQQPFQAAPHRADQLIPGTAPPHTAHAKRERERSPSLV